MNILIYICVIIGIACTITKIVRGSMKSNDVYKALNYSRSELIWSSLVMLPYSLFVAGIVAPSHETWIMKLLFWGVADLIRIGWIAGIHIAAAPKSLSVVEAIGRAFGWAAVEGPLLVSDQLRLCVS